MNDKNKEHFLLNVNVLEGRHYIWPDMNSVVFVIVDNQRFVTQVRRNSDSPYYNEFFFFEFTTNLQQLLDKTLKFAVLRPWSVCRKRKYLGDFSLDLGTIWNAPDHQFYNKWIILSAPRKDKGGGVRGFLKINLFLISRGQSPKIPVVDIDKTDEIDENLLIPGNVVERQRANYIFTVYKGINIIKEKYCFSKEKGNKCKEDAPNCYVEIRFAGLQARTTIKKKTAFPTWNERLVLNELFPPLYQRIRILLHHKDGVKDMVVSTSYIDLNSISSAGENGFLPTFGPAYVHFFFKSQCYAGRILFSVSTTINDNITPNLPQPTAIEHVSQYGEESLWTEKTVVLWGSILNVNSINKRFTNRTIQFETTMGGFCSNIGTDYKSENITGGYRARRDENMYFLNINEEKPCIRFVSEWFDFSGRLLRSNMLVKIVMRLKEKLKETEALFEHRNHISTAEMEIENRLIAAITELKKSSENYVRVIKSSETPIWNTELDLQRRRYIVEEMSLIKEECRTIYNQHSKAKTFRKLEKIYYRLEKLSQNIQGCWPFLYLWMIYGGKKVAYHRINPKHIIYTEHLEKRGYLCTIPQSLFFEDLSKNKQPFAYACRADVILWIGMKEEEHLIDSLLPEGFSLSSIGTGGNSLLKANETFDFSCKIHIFSGRISPVESRSGLCNAFIVVTIDKFSRRTKIIRQNLNPIWKETLNIHHLKLYGSKSGLKKYPPVATFDLYHHENLMGKRRNILIGRATVAPSVTFQNEDKQWQFKKHDVLFLDEKNSEILAAIDLYEVPQTNDQKNVNHHEKVKKSEPMSPEIMFPTVPHRVHVYFWGLRRLKKIVACLPITKPKIVLTLSSLKLESPPLLNAKNFLNFSSPLAKGEVNVSAITEYIPPLCFKMLDVRSFGRLTCVGTNMIYIYPFICIPITKRERDKKLEIKPTKGSKKGITKQKTFLLNFRENLSHKVYNFLFGSGDILQDKGMKKKFFSKKKGTLQKGQESFGNEEDWWTKYFASVQESSEEEDEKQVANYLVRNKIYVTETIYQITVFTKELEAESKFQKFQDTLTSFPMLTTKKTDDELIDAVNTTGLLKAAVKIYPLSLKDEDYVTEEGNSIEDGVFAHCEPNNGVKFIVRVYIIKGVELRSKDSNNKSDPFLVLTLGNQKINDVKNFIPSNLNPVFGKCFELRGELPKDYLLRIAVWDYNLSKKNRLIGETVIDLENRIYTRHRGRCGLSPEYVNFGPYKWRDQKTPTQILSRLCRVYNLDSPKYFDTYARIASKEFYINKYYSNPNTRIENLALAILRRWNEIPVVGCHLVPEHVETRSLYNPFIPGLEQGKLQMWIDIFPYVDIPLPPQVDVSPRKPVSYELRVIIWNTMEVTLNEDDFFTGEKKSDIYVKGWLNKASEVQNTDVHYRSFTGEGNFNWRFVFRFNYLAAENMMVYRHKEGAFVHEDVEYKIPCKFYVQVWDSDTFTPDDFLGTLTLPLSKMPRGAKTDKKCTLDNLARDAPFVNLFRLKRVKGWWPFINEEEGENKISGKLEAEFELLTAEEADKYPAGRGRDPPQPLPPPRRPAASFSLLKSPFHGIKFLIFKEYRGRILFCLLIVMVLIFFILFIYSLPRAVVERIVKGKL